MFKDTCVKQLTNNKLLRFNNFTNIILALVPILGIYEIIPGIGLETILLLFFFLLNFNLLSFNKNFSIFFFIILIISLFSFAFSVDQSYELYINNSLQVILFGVLLSYYSNFEINKFFVRTLQLAGLVSTVIIFYQSFSYYVFRKVVIFIVPLNESLVEMINMSSMNWGRPSSFFLEPAHYGIFILPILYYSLLNNKKTLSIIYLLGLLVSSSTTGFLVGIFILFYFIIIDEKKISYIFLVICVFVILSFFANEDVYEIVLNIVTRNFQKMEGTNLQENARLFGSSYALSNLNDFSLLFGLGHNQLSNFMFSRGVNMSNYANSYLMAIFSFGIAGLISLLILIKRLFKVNNNRGYFFIFILILLTDQILFNRNFFYLVICIFFLRNKFDTQLNITKLKT